jgi:type II secretory pathway component PulF
MFLTVLIVWAIGVFMVPPMVEVAPDVRWTGMAKMLVDVSDFVRVYWLPVFLAMPAVFVVIYISFSLWSGNSRRFVEGIPPYSLYRIFVGISWLLSLAALIKAGTPVSRAMRSLRTDASPYLLNRIDKALVYINNGDNLGDALYKTKLRFPDDEIIGDLRIYAELDNFQEALDQVAYEWLNTSEQDVEEKAAILNVTAIMFVSLVVAWSVMGTFDMQNQMVQALGIG